MYGNLKRVILGGKYRLSEMVEKVNLMWAESLISDEERGELMELAQQNLNPATQAPEMAELVQRLLERCDALEERVAALERGGVEGPAEADEWPEWRPWDGISDRYQPGAQVTHRGVRYVSIYEGQNVWVPGALGSDALWRKEEA